MKRITIVIDIPKDIEFTPTDAHTLSTRIGHKLRCKALNKPTDFAVTNIEGTIKGLITFEDIKLV